ncbi:MAG TPA: CheR family methyltransferase [Nevskiales bacterium]|nr:CheR family methyltransferase [Nevskiales bacterium]
MHDADCVAFLQWALPRMRLHWPGFRKVRRQVCKRIDRRLQTLGLADAAAYRSYLAAHAAEWDTLRGLCTVPISRFYRDREVFACLGHTVLPALAAAAVQRAQHTLDCWSAGCAGGEEPYTLSILWTLALAGRYPGLALRVLATDADPLALGRAAAGAYGSSSLKELPAPWRALAFEECAGEYRVRERFRAAVEFARQDLGETIPERRFDLVLCRNLVLTYFAPDLQRELMPRIIATLRPGGALVLGIHESLPEGSAELVPWPGARAIFRKGALPHDGPAAL